MIIDAMAYIAHYGTPRKSGRYPWGSGGTTAEIHKRNKEFLDYVDDLKSEGMTESQVAEALGIKTTELRARKTIAKNEQKNTQIMTAQKLRDAGASNVAIGIEMGLNESTVRSLLAAGAKEKADILLSTSNMLKRQVDEKGFLDVGTGVENHLGIAPTKLNTAVKVLEEQGYSVVNVQQPQLGTSQKTYTKVLAPPGTTYKDIVTNMDRIQSITETSDDHGRSWAGLLPMKTVNPDRVGIRYDEDGGRDADGVMYIRRGVDDLSLGGKNYAQVRIQVGDGHYLKGMAMYKDDMPPGVDIVFNTNKSNTGNKLDALKSLKTDRETGEIDVTNPFGSVVRQLTAKDANGKEYVTSAVNLVNEEGKWDTWSKNLSSQMLSKQNSSLAQQQLTLTRATRKADLDEIMSLTNPAVKRKLLEDFAEDVDAAAVHLKAHSLPRQATKVILPVNDLKPNEVYAPSFRNGERVVLIRYPHGGTFEIPEVTVNNKNPAAAKLLGNAQDAIGINAKVAERLSGADFDGDTVLVIPNNSNMVKTSPPLQQLKGFDPQRQYKAYDGMKTIDGGTYNAATGKVDFPEGKSPSPHGKAREMGGVSNLITDMTIAGAPHSELARAVKHSMVVIDAEKHKLDYRASARDNNIASLKAKYQGGANKGAATLISRKKRDIQVDERKQSYTVDPVTGKKIPRLTGASYVDKKTGETVIKKSWVKELAEVDDANSMSSGTPMEKVYADHSNQMKALANEARKASVAVKPVPYNANMNKVYKKEVQELDAALNLARLNRPRERHAQRLAAHWVQAKKDANPEMDKADLKKIQSQALAEARVRVNAHKDPIVFTPKQWEAVQAGAISNSKLTEILKNSDMEVVKTMATPRTKTLMNGAKAQRASALLAAGHTQAEVADILGVSLTTLKTGL